MAVLSFCISYAFFATSKEVDGVSFSFKKLDISIMVKQRNASGFVKADENEINFNNASISTGDGIFDGIGIANNANMTGYVRVKVNYSGTTTDAQKTAIALNSVLPTSVTYEDSTNGYGWTYSNGYFYLVNASDKEKVKEMNNNSNMNYILFNDTFKLVDLTQFGDTLGLSTTGVSLQIKAEAVQSTNLQYTEKNGTTKNVVSVSDLEKTITSSSIFSPYTEAGHIVRYDTCGGVSVDSYICLNSDESKVATLPQVSGVNVTWYKDISFTQSANSTAEESVSGKSYTVTNNITLYAKYSDSNKVKVFFNVNGGDENNTPATQEVTKGSGTTTKITVNKTPTRQGYKLSGWKVGKGGTTYSVSNGEITVNNSEITTNAITFYAVWEVLNYTITFDVGGNSTYINKLKAQFPTITQSGNNCILTYTINDAINLPKLDDTTINGDKCSFVGWQVSTASATEVWKIADILKANVNTSGLYGNVVIKPMWGIEQVIKYQHTEIVKTYGDEDFINPITCVSTENVTFSYSSNANYIADVDASTGKVHIKYVGKVKITATYAGGSISYNLTINKRDISNTVVIGLKEAYNYTGGQIKPEIKVQDPKNFDLSNWNNYLSSSDYSVTYVDNIIIGTYAKIIITAADGSTYYEGSKTVYFRIARMITVKANNQLVYMKDSGTLGGWSVQATEKQVTVTEGALMSGNTITSVDLKFLANGKNIMPQNVVIKSSSNIDVTNQYAITYEVGEFDTVSYWAATISNNVCSVKYNDNEKNVAIPSYCYYSSTLYPVTSIGDEAFKNKSITSVIIPDSVTTIGNSAFAYCMNLESIIIPDSVTTIGSSAFVGCLSLKGIKIPDGVKTISANAFSECFSLSNIILPSSLESIGGNAFNACRSLASITIPNTVTAIGYKAFYACANLAYVVVGATTPPSLGEYAFTFLDPVYEYLDDKYGNFRGIYVPRNCENAYKNATGWSDCSAVIFSASS